MGPPFLRVGLVVLPLAGKREREFGMAIAIMSLCGRERDFPETTTLRIFLGLGRLNSQGDFASE
ncbi:hypothetical protein J2X73_002646 [Novosphingobium sp. 1748]|nr:hypothetical protein [Novosphingobium sp. 1748]